MVSDRIKIAIAVRNMTQKDLADAIGVTQATMTRYCKNQRKPTADAIIKICKTLNISADWLLEL